MCGIVGAASDVAVDETLTRRMRDRLHHRGPDASGLWRAEDQRVVLAHTRLSVIDPSPEADQPFLSEDGRLVVVLNGEIYNFRALREELSLLGSTFRTRSDTEVLLEAYRHFGEDCLERLSGMFSFAIWDGERRRLFCARDRAGEKPFYYALVGRSFVFASELKSILVWPGFRRDLDGAALADFLTYGFVPDPKTIWCGARKLPPGHSLSVELGPQGALVGEPQTYWDMSFEPDRSVDDWGLAIRDALEAAAAEMAYADVPVGTFLSGGVDSSAVTAALARSGHDVHAFTVGFRDPDYDERPYAREVARIFGIAHTERNVEPDDVDRVLREIIPWHFDEPFADYSYLPTYYVCREARDSITVALTGDGGDELFAGYRKYGLLARRAGLERSLSRPVAHLVAAGARAVVPQQALAERFHRYEQRPEDLLVSTLVTGIRPAELRRSARGLLADALVDYDPVDAVRPHLSNAPPAEVGLVNAMRYLDLKLTLGSGILTKVDRASMAVSLETRPVFLHRSMLELAGRVPPERLVEARTPKKLLRNALRPWLPSSILDRPKMGFAMPLGRWLRGDLSHLTRRIAAGRLADLLDPGYAATVARDHALGRVDRTAELHNLIFLDQWLETWS